MKDRLELAVIGALAGLSLWALFEFLDDFVTSQFAILTLASGAVIFFATLMALVGPERPQRALAPSAVLAFAAGLLTLWAALRFGSVADFNDRGHPFFAISLIFIIGAPFAAAALEAKDGWRDYARLFDSAWGIFIRYVAGGLFAGLIFIVLLLSDALLKLVGISIIADLMEYEWFNAGLAGAMFGLGIATVYELRGYVSPVLVHRLLRMLLPLVLVVVVVFLGALPFRGLSDLFGKLSTGAVLMSVAFAAITLITTALDRDDENAAQMALMRYAAQIMALLLPALVALSIYAIWLRVSDYGWTPERVIAAYIALFLAGYAAVYAYAVIRRKGWMAQLRQGNLYMALAVLAGALVWLTPVMSAEGISARSQLARAEAGGIEPRDLPLYEMAHEWGHAGQDALEALKQKASAPLAARIADAQAADSKWAFRRGESGNASPQGRKEIAERIAVLPQGETLGDTFDKMRPNSLDQLDRICPKGEAPSCAVVVMPRPARGGANIVGLLFVKSRSSVQSIVLDSAGEAFLGGGKTVFDDAGKPIRMDHEAFERVLRQEFEIVPRTEHTLRIGGANIYP